MLITANFLPQIPIEYLQPLQETTLESDSFVLRYRTLEMHLPVDRLFPKGVDRTILHIKCIAAIDSVPTAGRETTAIVAVQSHRWSWIISGINSGSNNFHFSSLLTWRRFGKYTSSADKFHQLSPPGIECKNITNEHKSNTTLPHRGITHSALLHERILRTRELSAIWRTDKKLKITFFTSRTRANATQSRKFCLSLSTSQHQSAGNCSADAGRVSESE